jgi:hypothetical protein
MLLYEYINIRLKIAQKKMNCLKDYILETAPFLDTRLLFTVMTSEPSENAGADQNDDYDYYDYPPYPVNAAK